MTEQLKNFFGGIGSVLNLTPSEGDFNQRLQQIHPYQSDREAMQSDFEKIGSDLYGAMHEVDDEQREHA
ncbi:MAG: hypothetical protein HON68_09115 [Gammaproteobacteria bacterium]|jgi:hypothetical protein|nr:hypothetical protein [Gammaproteobacteria bacterium]MBT3490044.1 hypothetical protein [Gammaproteobacteria bacterium]MBT3719518.1 hypothetical protein [Gammaproteobacteria bacterium]MBT3845972.1 hypothetical protein [Gammaproteobacteria bacterium]MBT3892935.1 hypothetical protein [Gammaproteobacteria bacterium]